MYFLQVSKNLSSILNKRDFEEKIKPSKLKLNYRKKVFYFALNFLPWEILLIKKLDFENTKATY